ncbi:MAG: GNAT family N-acetyltransferase [Parvularculales bacterium]
MLHDLDDVTMNTASADDMKTIVEFSRAEGWNPGKDDAIIFRATDPKGFYVAKHKGEVIASISVVNHNDTFAYMGFYICRPDYRGKGIGMALWNHAIKWAGTRDIGLDGVREQEANYVKSGFVKVMDSCRYEGQLAGRGHPDIRLAGDDDIDDLIEMDAAANGVRRSVFVQVWTASTPDRKTVMFDDGSGFATIRACQNGVKIGPVICDDVNKAMMLVEACLDLMPSDPVIIDVPEENTAMIKTLTGKGFSETFVAARMYRGKVPQISPRLHAIAGMELG